MAKGKRRYISPLSMGILVLCAARWSMAVPNFLPSGTIHLMQAQAESERRCGARRLRATPMLSNTYLKRGQTGTRETAAGGRHCTPRLPQVRYLLLGYL